jgi:hypothetical protein
MDPNDLRARVEVEIRDLIEPVAWERWRGRQPGGTGELAACARSGARSESNWRQLVEAIQLQLEFDR